MPDPFLKRVPSDEMPDRIREMHAKSLALRGDATFFEVAASAPEALTWYIDSLYGEMFYAERIPIKTIELARLYLSTLHGCRFCNQGNTEAAIRAGVSLSQIGSLPEFENDLFSKSEQAVLHLATQVSLTSLHGEMSGSLYGDLSEHFTDGQIFELGLILSILSGIAKFLFVFDLVEKEETCPVQSRRK